MNIRTWIGNKRTTKLTLTPKRKIGTIHYELKTSLIAGNSVKDNQHLYVK